MTFAFIIVISTAILFKKLNFRPLKSIQIQSYHHQAQMPNAKF